MRKKLLGGVIALALVLAPAAAANADTYVPAPGTLHGTIDKSVVSGCSAEVVTYTAQPGTFDPNEAVVEKVNGANGSGITLASTVSGATFDKTAEADGSLTFALTMPKGSQGNYTLDVYRASGSVWDPFTISVTPCSAGNIGDNTGNTGGNTGNTGGNTGNTGDTSNSAGSGSNSTGTSGLAKTGSDIAIYSISGIAVLLFLAGIALLVTRRRRSSAGEAA